MTSARPYDLIVFDLDGVITTEHIYWECARLTLWELLYVRLGVGRPYVQAVHDAAARQAILPEALIFQIKNRAINSNWDLTYLGVCALIGSVRHPVSVEGESLASFWRALKPGLGDVSWPDAMRDLLDQAGEQRGADLVECAGRNASRASGAPEAWFGPEGPIWQAAYARFQMWYDGRLTGVWGASPLAERPVIALADIQNMLADLAEQGYTLGVATGRPRDEAVKPLTQFEILDRFDPAADGNLRRRAGRAAPRRYERVGQAASVRGAQGPGSGRATRRTGGREYARIGSASADGGQLSQRCIGRPGGGHSLPGRVERRQWGSRRAGAPGGAPGGGVYGRGG